MIQFTLIIFILILWYCVFVVFGLFHIIYNFFSFFVFYNFLRLTSFDRFFFDWFFQTQGFLIISKIVNLSLLINGTILLNLFILKWYLCILLIYYFSLRTGSSRASLNWTVTTTIIFVAIFILEIIIYWTLIIVCKNWSI